MIRLYGYLPIRNHPEINSGIRLVKFRHPKNIALIEYAIYQYRDITEDQAYFDNIHVWRINKDIIYKSVITDTDYDIFLDSVYGHIVSFPWSEGYAENQYIEKFKPIKTEFGDFLAV